MTTGGGSLCTFISPSGGVVTLGQAWLERPRDLSSLIRLRPLRPQKEGGWWRRRMIDDTPALIWRELHTHTQTHEYGKLNRVKTVSWCNISVFTYIMRAPRFPHPPLPQKPALPKSLKTPPPLQLAPTKPTFVQRLWHVILTNILH